MFASKIALIKSATANAFTGVTELFSGPTASVTIEATAEAVPEVVATVVVPEAAAALAQDVVKKGIVQVTKEAVKAHPVIAGTAAAVAVAGGAYVGYRAVQRRNENKRLAILRAMEEAPAPKVDAEPVPGAGE